MRLEPFVLVQPCGVGGLGCVRWKSDVSSWKFAKSGGESQLTSGSTEGSPPSEGSVDRDAEKVYYWRRAIGSQSKLRSISILWQVSPCEEHDVQTILLFD